MIEQPEFPEQLFLELPDLIEQCVNGAATAQQIARLDRLMVEDEQARKLYVRYVHTLCALRTWSEYQLVESGSGDTASVSASLPEGLPEEDRIHLATSPFPLPLHHPPRHGRLFFLGLAGGVSGGDGDFRDRALDRLPYLRVPAGAGCPAIRPSPLPCPPSPLSPQWSAGSLAWSIAQWVGKGSRVVPGVAGDESGPIPTPEIPPNPLFPSATSSTSPPACWKSLTTPAQR